MLFRKNVYNRKNMLEEVLKGKRIIVDYKEAVNLPAKTDQEIINDDILGLSGFRLDCPGWARIYGALEKALEGVPDKDYHDRMDAFFSGLTSDVLYAIGVTKYNPEGAAWTTEKIQDWVELVIDQEINVFQ